MSWVGKIYGIFSFCYLVRALAMRMFRPENREEKEPRVRMVYYCVVRGLNTDIVYRVCYSGVRQSGIPAWLEGKTITNGITKFPFL